MSSLMPSTSGGGLQFELFGFPVTISLSIVLLLGFLGLVSGFDSPLAIGLWVVIGVLSILLHELGHAVVARAAGASPEVRLAGLGGVTSYRQTPRTRGRAWSLAISLSGPAVGIAIGLGALALGASFTVPREATPGEFAASVFVFTSLVWGVLNLLPILPLDGGQALAQLLPGGPGERRRRAAVVSIAIGVVVVGAALVAGAPFGAIVVGLMTWQNVQLLQSDRRHAELRALVESGRLGEARARLDAGEGDPELLNRLQRRALEHGQLQTAAEVGEIALARGWEHPSYALLAARAWARLGASDRAFTLLDRAVAMGVEPDRIHQIEDLAPLRGDERWIGLGNADGAPDR